MAKREQKRKKQKHFFRFFGSLCVRLPLLKTTSFECIIDERFVRLLLRLEPIRQHAAVNRGGRSETRLFNKAQQSENVAQCVLFLFKYMYLVAAEHRMQQLAQALLKLFATLVKRAAASRENS